MILLQISSAQGPDECAFAVALALKQLQKEAAALGVKVTVAEQEPARRAGTLRSVLLSLDGDAAEHISNTWCGTLLWTCESPWRGGNGRKYWFIGVARYCFEDVVIEGEIKFESLKSSGPGGQHVNKTESAIRATHLASGIVVKVQTERSQHANKRLAKLLIAHKLEQQQQNMQSEIKAQRRMFHHQITRGNPVRMFKGPDFTPVK